MSILFILGLVCITLKVLEPRQEIINEQIPSVSANEYALIIDGKVLSKEEVALEVGGKYYFNLDVVSKYITDDFFYDEMQDLVTYTDYYNVIKMPVGQQEQIVNGEKQKLSTPIKRLKKGIYIPYDLLYYKYQLKLMKSPYLHILMLDTDRDIVRRGQVATKNMPLYKSTGSEEVLQFAMANEKYRYFDAKEQGWSYVVLEDGLTGYVPTKLINPTEEVKPKVKKATKPVRDDKVVLGWHQVFNTTASKNTEVLQNAPGIEVVSPTWFAFANETGTIKSIASKSYVEWAHRNGIEVWALVNDFSAGKNVDKAIFTDPDKRQYVIDQLLSLAKVYNLDGINIDFEKVPKEVGPYFVQFMRELAPQLRNAGIVSSVDVYVPSAWTAHYRRDILGEFMDYVMIMGYDEHWGGGPKSGSVSSMNFVDQAIRKTLELVPKEKVILGVPYYTRLWAEKNIGDDKIELTSKAYGMDSAKVKLQQQQVAPVWLSDIGQYYGEYTKGDTTYKVWLEDERSMEWRLKKIVEYDLAGVAAWKLRLENKNIWPLINDYIK